MNLYRISQSKNDDYDSYDSAVVAADDEQEACMIHPGKSEWDGKDENFSSWCAAEHVKVELVGVAVDGTKRGVICASFNAG